MNVIKRECTQSHKSDKTERRHGKCESVFVFVARQKDTADKQKERHTTQHLPTRQQGDRKVCVTIISRGLKIKPT